MRVPKTVMWASLGLLAWTHVGYPLAAAVGGRVRRYRPRADADHTPRVALVVVAHNEGDVIRDRLENALELEYPRERLQVVVALDGSTDDTRAVAERFAARGVRVHANERAGKVAAQNAAVRTVDADVLAFSDANSMWEPAALRMLVGNLADPEVGYVSGRLAYAQTDGIENREGLYWRYEGWLRASESALDSITAGNGAIYAVRRDAFVELEPEFNHDLGLPFRLRRRGFRSVYEPDAVAVEPLLPSTSAEWPRKVRMLARAWWEILHGGILDPRGQPPIFYAELVSHRLLRYSSGLLHLTLLLASLVLARHDRPARAVVAAQCIGVALAAAGARAPGRVPLAGVAWYYVLVTAASVAGLGRVLLHGPQRTWTPDEGARTARRDSDRAA